MRDLTVTWVTISVLCAGGFASASLLGADHDDQDAGAAAAGFSARVSAPSVPAVVQSRPTERAFAKASDIEDPFDAEPGEASDFASLEGVLAFEDGEAVEADQLFLRSEDHERHNPERRAGGAFAFVVPPGTYELWTRAWGAVPERVTGIVLGSGEDIRGMVITLRRGHTIRGRAISDGAPASTEVVLWGHGYLYRAWTDADGTFEFKGLLEGTYRVSAVEPLLGGAAVDARTGGFALLDLTARQVELEVTDGHGGAIAVDESLVVFTCVKPPFRELHERDPLGELDQPSPANEPSPGSSLCADVAPDEHGRFKVFAPSGSGVTVTGSHRALIGSVSFQTPPAQATLRLGPSRPLTFRVSRPESPDDGQAALEELVALLENSEFGLQLPQPTVTAEGNLRVDSWPGLDTTLEVHGGLELEPIDPLPSTMRIVKVAEPMCGDDLHPEGGNQSDVVTW